MSLESFKAFSLAGVGFESETDISVLGTDFHSGEILLGGIVTELSKGMEIWRDRMRLYRMSVWLVVLNLAVSSGCMSDCNQGVSERHSTMLGMNSIGGVWMDLLKSYEVIGSLIASQLVMTSGSRRRAKFRYLRAKSEFYD